jgi:hypothetical protein
MDRTCDGTDAGSERTGTRRFPQAVTGTSTAALAGGPPGTDETPVETSPTATPTDATVAVGPRFGSLTALTAAGVGAWRHVGEGDDGE